jgi:hypothetical protein
MAGLAGSRLIEGKLLRPRGREFQPGTLADLGLTKKRTGMPCDQVTTAPRVASGKS